ncbi:MAG: carbon-nitrogen family hydrolase [Desulfobacterales bacterium]|nr:carbon-nitrogen family hydrolase [Desulfobacterales bacterium]
MIHDPANPIKTRLKAAVCQFDIAAGDMDRNIETGLAAAENACKAGAQLVVLPELWSCGYDGEKIADHARKTPEITGFLAGLAKAYGAVIAGSLPEKANGCVYNTMYVINSSDGTAAAYRKIHLFPLLDEDKWFAPGRQSVVLDCHGIPAGCMICYDLRFAEMGVHLAAGGARMILVCAQWPAVRIDHWDALLMARAIENQIFMVAANRCAADADAGFNGHSRIIAPDGAILADAGQMPAHVCAELDFSVIDNLRTRFCPVAQRVPAAYPPA